MNRKIWLAITVLVLIWGSVAFAGQTRLFGPDFEALKALWGSDITTRELLEQVWPEELVRLDPKFWDTPVTWGGEGETVKTTLRWEGPGDPPTTDVSGEPAPAAVIVIAHTVRVSERHGDVNFGASSTVIVPPFRRVPYMRVVAYLLESGGPIAATWDDGHNVWRVTASDRESVEGGAYYRTTGWHTGTSPPGYTPPTWSVWRWSREIWVP